MAGMEFEYDEEGGTFYYFLTSFWALFLIPVTIYVWPRRKTKDEQERIRRQCNCPPCQSKGQLVKVNSSWLRTRETAVKLGIIVAWLILVLLVYKVSKIQMDYEEYDPFTELQIDRGATDREVKRAYRKLSVLYHPDKDRGDAKKFMRIAKAYAALTNEESKKNWEEYGNPDGPGVMRFGIALPKWIIEDDNSLWVLGVYIVIFMVILPVVVGMWWYRSIKFSKDQVLLDTTRLYFYFFQKVQNMILKKTVMVLAASFEFDKLHNSEIQERASDNEEVPMLMKQLPNLDEKNKEKPLCFGYSVKARALLHAHFARLELPRNTLDQDRIYILRKCPSLITEMINIISQLVASAMARQMLQYMPRLETVENCMKMSQQVTQGLDTKSSPLQQLPHIRPDMLRHFVTKKRNIQRIRDLIDMPEEERRQLLRTLNDNEYQNVMNVCATMPNVEMSVKSEVLDDDDSTVTAGSIVTVTVTLKRRNLMDNFNIDRLTGDVDVHEAGEEEDEEREQEDEGEDNKLCETANTAESKHKAWQKQAKGKKKGGKVKAKKVKQPYQWKKPVQTVGPKSEDTNNANASEATNDADVENTDSENDDVDNQSSDEETPAPEKKVSKSRSRKTSEKTSEKDDDDWDKYQEESKKENSMEAKVKESHPVHCPHFPDEKQEGWWLYAADKKKHMLVSAPLQILSLKTEEEQQLKFSAPPKTGIYTYSIILKSDSYVDFDQVHNIKLDVKEAKVVEDHPQWDISSDEEDKGPEEDEASGDSDYSTDDSDY